MCGPKGRLPDCCCQDGCAGGTILAEGSVRRRCRSYSCDFFGKPLRETDVLQGIAEYPVKDRHFLARVKVCRNIRY